LLVEHVPEHDEAPVRVLFVCTANIARSPYAEHRARQLVDGAGLTVASAGVPGVPGRKMDADMAAQLRARGGNADGHVSRALTRDLLEEAELVLTFEFAHRMRILQAWPEHAAKVFGIRQLGDAVGRLVSPEQGLELLDQAYAACQPDGMQWDVVDPHRRGAAAARVCADAIDADLAVIVPALTGASPHLQQR
jgi:protein-tyrosine phosphatase